MWQSAFETFLVIDKAAELSVMTKYRVFNFLPRTDPSFPWRHLSILYRQQIRPYDTDTRFLRSIQIFCIEWKTFFRGCLSNYIYPYYTDSRFLRSIHSRFSVFNGKHTSGGVYPYYTYIRFIHIIQNKFIHIIEKTYSTDYTKQI